MYGETVKLDCKAPLNSREQIVWSFDATFEYLKPIALCISVILRGKQKAIFYLDHCEHHKSSILWATSFLSDMC
jgi:hypothetical protein